MNQMAAAHYKNCFRRQVHGGAMPRLAPSEPAAPMIPYQPEHVPAAEGLLRVRPFRQLLDGRRSVRHFDPDADVPAEVIEEILRAAGSAPSGANKQPWTFVAVHSPELKAQIRTAAEEQERRFHEETAPKQWLDDIAPMRVTWTKPHLTEAPWIIVVFAQDYGLATDGTKSTHYYVTESVGIAVGMLLAAARRAGLATLTHTPSPMGFMQELLGRPANERTYLLIPVGYPAANCEVPALRRKDLEEFVVWR